MSVRVRLWENDPAGDMFIGSRTDDSWRCNIIVQGVNHYGRGSTPEVAVQNAVLALVRHMQKDILVLVRQIDTIEHEQDSELVQQIARRYRIKRRFE